jgi:hypothetical protein
MNGSDDNEVIKECQGYGSLYRKNTKQAYVIRRDIEARLTTISIIIVNGVKETKKQTNPSVITDTLACESNKILKINY